MPLSIDSTRVTPAQATLLAGLPALQARVADWGNAQADAESTVFSCKKHGGSSETPIQHILKDELGRSDERRAKRWIPFGNDVFQRQHHHVEDILQSPADGMTLESMRVGLPKREGRLPRNAHLVAPADLQALAARCAVLERDSAKLLYVASSSDPVVGRELASRDPGKRDNVHALAHDVVAALQASRYVHGLAERALGSAEVARYAASLPAPDWDNLGDYKHSDEPGHVLARSSEYRELAAKLLTQLNQSLELYDGADDNYAVAVAALEQARAAFRRGRVPAQDSSGHLLVRAYEGMLRARSNYFRACKAMHSDLTTAHALAAEIAEDAKSLQARAHSIDDQIGF